MCLTVSYGEQRVTTYGAFRNTFGLAQDEMRLWEHDPGDLVDDSCLCTVDVATTLLRAGYVVARRDYGYEVLRRND